MYIIVDDVLSTIKSGEGCDMDGLKNISGWIIAMVLAVILGVGAAGCVKRVQQAGVEQGQAIDAEQRGWNLYFARRRLVSSVGWYLTRYPLPNHPLPLVNRYR
jgi:hypothetical protein